MTPSEHTQPKTSNGSAETNDSGHYITVPFICFIKPLPQRGHKHRLQGQMRQDQCQNDMIIIGEDIVAPSNILFTPFLLSSRHQRATHGPQPQPPSLQMAFHTRGEGSSQSSSIAFASQNLLAQTPLEKYTSKHPKLSRKDTGFFSSGVFSKIVPITARLPIITSTSTSVGSSAASAFRLPACHEDYSSNSEEESVNVHNVAVLAPSTFLRTGKSAKSPCTTTLRSCDIKVRHSADRYRYARIRGMEELLDRNTGEVEPAEDDQNKDSFRFDVSEEWNEVNGTHIEHSRELSSSSTSESYSISPDEDMDYVFWTKLSESSRQHSFDCEEDELVDEKVAMLASEYGKGSREYYKEVVIEDEIEEETEYHPPLEDYWSLLPPRTFAFNNSDPTPLPLWNFSALIGRRLEFLKLKNLTGGNGTSSLEVVRSNAHQEGGLGFPTGSLWVVKRFRTDLQAANTVSASAIEQSEKECATYMRIVEASKSECVGFDFLVSLEATMTLDEDLCLVLPLMSTDLGQLLDEKVRKNFSMEDVRRVTAQIAIGLATLHSIGIIHSDLKPANVFIDSRGNVKLGDFGLSWVATRLGPLAADGQYTSARVGTKGYMAPEKMSGDKYSYQVDYWSLGWILYEMVSEGKELMDALNESDDLGNWAFGYTDIIAREEYFEDEMFDEDTLELLCGLLDPNPRTRMGIEDIILHPFFEEDGIVALGSEFSNMRQKALERSEEPPTRKWDAPARVKYTSMPTNDTAYRWINPYGAYASGIS